MGIISTIRRHAAIARGNFAAMFKEVEIPPLPAAVTHLISELNQPEPDLDKLEKLISSEAGIASKLIRTVNSPFFGLKRPATNVKHVISLLGFQQVKSIVLACATMEAIPSPQGDLFDHEAFWIDSLLKALFSRSIAKQKHLGHPEDVFTATLLADVALPVLLTAWREYYEPVVEEWKQTQGRLSEIERAHFGWDHAQAGAWIAHSWGLPEEMVCYIGVHNLSWDKLEEFELSNTLACAATMAALLPSVLKPDKDRIIRMVDETEKRLNLGSEDLYNCITEVTNALSEILILFELSEQKAQPIIQELEGILQEQNRKDEDGQDKRQIWAST